MKRLDGKVQSGSSGRIDLERVLASTAGRLICCLCIVICGCSGKSGPAPNSSGIAANPPDDDGVFDVVLRDLTANSDFNDGLSPDERRIRVIVLDDRSAGEMSRRLLRDECAIPGKQVPLDLRSDLVSRNSKGSERSLRGYSPRTPNVIVRDLSKADLDLGFLKAFPGARGYVRAFQPGYSRDGKSALFAYFFGPNPHTAIGYYLIDKVDGEWKVRWRQLVYFN
jgi:hypothetical protein